MPKVWLRTFIDKPTGPEHRVCLRTEGGREANAPLAGVLEFGTLAFGNTTEAERDAIREWLDTYTEDGRLKPRMFVGV